MDVPTKTMTMKPSDTKCTGLKRFRERTLCFWKIGSSIGSEEEQRALAEARRLVIDVVLKEIESSKPKIGGAEQKYRGD